MNAKHILFAAIAILLSAFAGFLLVELGLRIVDRSPVKSTWLEMHERGFMMNRADTDGLHTYNDIRVCYHLSPQRTRGSAVDEKDINIWVFGDSFTFGLLLEEEDSFVYQLNERVKEVAPDSGVRFINAGIGGTGLADWLAFLETYGDEQPIDGLLFVQNYDDFARAVSKNLYVTDDAGGLQESRRWRERAVKSTLDESLIWKQLQEHSRLFSFLQSLLWNKYYFEDVKAENGIPNPFAEFETLDDYHAYTLRLIPLLYARLTRFTDERQLPIWITTSGFMGKEDADEVNNMVYAELPAIMDNLDLYYDDITPELSSRINDDYDAIRISGDTHPDPSGAALIAELLWARSGTTILEHFTREKP
jgi:lysophospholipase L1-like esterase